MYGTRRFVLIALVALNVASVRSSRKRAAKPAPSPAPVDPEPLSDYQSSIAYDDLDRVGSDYPQFMKLTLRQQKYYTESGATLCPMPYDGRTERDDPDIKKMEYFDPRILKTPWTWTQRNEMLVAVPPGCTVGKRLEEVVKPYGKKAGPILQKYAHYMNTIESVGVTLMDRFCLFSIEVVDRIEKVKKSKAFTEEVTLFNVEINYHYLHDIVMDFKDMLSQVINVFHRFSISTLQMDCVGQALKKYSSKPYTPGKPFKENSEKFKAHLMECRTLNKTKKDYAVLPDDDQWKWDLDTEDKPDNKMILVNQKNSTHIGTELFRVHK